MDDDFIRPHHSDRIYDAYVVSVFFMYHFQILSTYTKKIYIIIFLIILLDVPSLNPRLSTLQLWMWKSVNLALTER